MTAPDLLRGLRSGLWLDQQEFPPARYSVPGLVPEGLGLLVGAPKIGKSWFVLALALAKAAGGVVLGSIRVDAAPVLYLALEDGDRRLQERCRVLMAGQPIPAPFEYMTRTEPEQIVETIYAWRDLHREAAPLVILDTLGKVMPPALAGESSYQRDYRIGSALKRVADSEPGMSLIVNHHDRKALAEDFIDSVSGTHGLAGAADTIIVLNRRRIEQNGTLMVTGRDVSEGTYAVTFNGASWSLEGDDLVRAAERAEARRVSAGVGDLSRKIVDFVASHPDGVRAAEIAAFIGKEDKWVGTYLGRLAEAGRVRRLGRGLYGPAVGSVESVEMFTLEPQPTPRFHTVHSSNSASGDQKVTSDSKLQTGPGLANLRNTAEKLCCVRCGSDRLYSRESIARKICASCWQKEQESADRQA